MTEIRITVELTASAELLSVLNEMVAAIGFHAKALSMKTDELVADIIEAADRDEAVTKRAEQPNPNIDAERQRETADAVDHYRTALAALPPPPIPETDPPRARAAPPRARVIGTEGPTAGAVRTSAPAGPSWATLERVASNPNPPIHPKGPIDTTTPTTPIVASLMQIADWASPRGITVRTASDVQAVNARCRAIGHRPFELEPPRNGAR